MVGIFITPWRRKNGERFDFVRFRDVRDDGALEKELNNISFGDTILIVNHPQYVKKGPTPRTQYDRKMEARKTNTRFLAYRREGVVLMPKQSVIPDWFEGKLIINREELR